MPVPLTTCWSAAVVAASPVARASSVAPVAVPVAPNVWMPLYCITGKPAFASMYTSCCTGEPSTGLMPVTVMCRVSTPAPCGRMVTPVAVPVSCCPPGFSPLAGAFSRPSESCVPTAATARSIAVFSETLGVTESSFRSV